MATKSQQAAEERLLFEKRNLEIWKAVLAGWVINPCPLPSPLALLTGCAAAPTSRTNALARPAAGWRMRAEQHLVLDDKTHHMLWACSLPPQHRRLCLPCATIPMFSLWGISVFSLLCETPAFRNHFVTLFWMYFVLPRYFFLSFLALCVIPNAAFQQHFQMCKSWSSLRYFCQHDWELRLTADYHHPASSFCWSFTIQKSDACLPLSSTGESSFPPVYALNTQLSRNAVIKWLLSYAVANDCRLLTVVMCLCCANRMWMIHRALPSRLVQFTGTRHLETLSPKWNACPVLWKTIYKIIFNRPIPQLSVLLRFRLWVFKGRESATSRK